jgi:hypothetical protein
MTNERAERLREAVRAEMFRKPDFEWETPSAQSVLAVVVAELSITREMADYCEVRDCVTAADVFTTLLDAAGVEP